MSELTRRGFLGAAGIAAMTPALGAAAIQTPQADSSDIKADLHRAEKQVSRVPRARSPEHDRHYEPLHITP